jgi:tripartite-type tricarboxylate transporter receptor subunit TctC
MHKLIAAALAPILAMGFASIAPASAQEWPTKSIRIVVPGSPGGAIDLVARFLADKLPASLGQAVVVENKPGASNILGTDIVAKSAPDGYNLVIVALSHATNPSLFKKMPFDAIKDFEPVSMTHTVPLALVVGSSVPAKNVEELIAWLKANPDKATYASSGQGQVQHMSAELFKSMAKLELLHVPYKGSTFAHPDLIAGRTSIMFDTITAVQPHLKSGALKALAVTTATRAESLPDVPTVAESGLPGFDTSTWGGILAPARTPKAVIAKLNAEINKALDQPDVREKLAGAGIKAQGSTAQQLGDFVQAEMVKWAKVTKDAGIVPE